MTTITPFTPNLTAPFTFQPVLDGVTYQGTVKSNLFGARYYLLLQATDGTIIFNLPLIGSPGGFNIENLTWAFGQVQAETAAAHGLAIGSVVDLTITGCVPDAYNGVVPALITGPQTFQWPLSADPGQAMTLGIATYNIDLAAGYFETSTLVFREASQSFEVSP